ncbi:MAG: hypothetical protein JWM44_3050 [Bacilli bacterium]|nr:hypothetical protein [Bacilli bacterium]
MDEQRVRVIVLEEFSKKEAAALEPAAVIQQQIQFLEATKARAINLMGSSSTPAFEAALSKVDCSLRSFRQQLSELSNPQKCEGLQQQDLCPPYRVQHSTLT